MHIRLLAVDIVAPFTGLEHIAKRGGTRDHHSTTISWIVRGSIIVQLPPGYDPDSRNIRSLDLPPLYGELLTGLPGIPQTSAERRDDT